MSKAVQFDRYGDSEVLDVRDLPTPGPGADGVLVRSAPRASTRARPRSARAPSTKLPSHLPDGRGHDLAGVVAGARSDRDQTPPSATR